MDANTPTIDPGHAILLVMDYEPARYYADRHTRRVSATAAEPGAR